MPPSTKVFNQWVALVLLHNPCVRGAPPRVRFCHITNDRIRIYVYGPLNKEPDIGGSWVGASSQEPPLVKLAQKDAQMIHYYFGQRPLPSIVFEVKSHDIWQRPWLQVLQGQLHRSRYCNKTSGRRYSYYFSFACLVADLNRVIAPRYQFSCRIIIKIWRATKNLVKWPDKRLHV